MKPKNLLSVIPWVIGWVLVVSQVNPNPKQSAKPLGIEWEFRSKSSSKSAVDLSPDGALLASGGFSNIEIHNPDSGALVQSLLSHRTHALRFRKDKTLVAFTSQRSPEKFLINTGKIGFYDPKKSEALKEIDIAIPGHPHIPPAAFDEAGAILAVGGYMGDLAVVDTESGRTIWTRNQAHDEQIRCVAVTADGRFVATAGNDRLIHMWRTRTGELVSTVRAHQTYIVKVAFSPDGQFLASGDAQGAVRIWETASGKMVRNFAGHRTAITAMSFNSNGLILATGAEDLGMKLWDTNSGTLLLEQPAIKSEYLRFSNENKRLFVVSYWDATVSSRLIPGHLQRHPGLFRTPPDPDLSWSPAEIQPVWKRVQEDPVLDLAVSPDGTKIAILELGSGNLSLRGANDGMEIWKTRIRSSTNSTIKFYEGSKILGTSRSYDKGPEFVEAASGKLLQFADLQDHHFTMMHIQEGRLIKRYDFPTINSGELYTFQRSGAISWAVSPDQQWFAISDEDGIHIKQPSGEALKTIAASASQLKFSNDSVHLSWFRDDRIEVYSIPLAKVVNSIPVPDKRINFELSPNSQLIAIGPFPSGSDFPIRLIDARTGKELAALKGHTNWATPLFTPDGQFLITAAHRELWFWDIREFYPKSK
ncbi:MAG: PQQ-binding-like beta-propeller repeat protein [Leptospirales bacterium]|nr:PQQ-binding-like beta-propeller repeat protein [Leptospirales bacterium]